MITQGELNIQNSFGIYGIEEFEYTIVPNQHGSARLVGIARDFSEYDSWKHADEDKLIKLYAGEDTLLFAGYVKSADCSYESDIHYITLDLVSTSWAIDRDKESKSFQNVKASYKDIVMKSIEKDNATCVFYTDASNSIGMPLIRYRETTWAFARRMASHFNDVIYPQETSIKPAICFGLKKSEGSRKIRVNSYSHGVDERYWKVKGKCQCMAGDFEYYKLKSYDNCLVGDAIEFDNRKMYIVEKRCVLNKSMLEFEYIISGKFFVSIPKEFREGFAGLTLLGQVIGVSGETVKLQLDIDKEQDESEAYPYSWVPDTGSVMYCMPEKGTRVSLYFPDEDEKNAIAVSCIRENGGSCAAMGNTEMKNFASPSGNEMFIRPEETGLNAPGSGQSIALHDATGIDIGGTMKVCIFAADEIELTGKTVTIDTPSLIQMVKK